MMVAVVAAVGGVVACAAGNEAGGRLVARLPRMDVDLAARPNAVLRLIAFATVRLWSANFCAASFAATAVLSRPPLPGSRESLFFVLQGACAGLLRAFGAPCPAKYECARLPACGVPAREEHP